MAKKVRRRKSRREKKSPKLKTQQQILNASMIHYLGKEYRGMCIALHDAYLHGNITQRERNLMREVIRGFLGTKLYLTDILREHGARTDAKYLRTIYRDWDNRYKYLCEMKWYEKIWFGAARFLNRWL